MTLATLKTPPHSIDLEQAVIGGIINDSSAIDRVYDLVSVGDFYRPEYGLIFQICEKLASDNQPIDPVSVTDQIHKQGKLEECGGLDHVVDVISNSRGSANLEHYAKGIRDRAIERRIIAAGHTISDIGYNGEGKTSDKLEETQRLVMDLGASEEKTDLVGVDQIAQELIEEIDYRSGLEGGIIGLSTGFKDLDQKTGGFEAGDMIVLAGRPSMGKSALAMNIVEDAVLDGKLCLVFSLEMPKKALLMRSYANKGDIPFESLRKGNLVGDQWSRLNQVADDFKSTPLWIDDSSGLSPAQIRSRARRLQRKQKRDIDLIVIDYLQLMGDTGNGFANDNSRISSISRQVKGIAKEFNCPVLVLSQLSRKLEERANKRPISSDLRDSGAIEQDADLILMAYRDEVYSDQSECKGIAELIITKQRNGPLGTVHLSTQLEYMRFKDFAGQYPIYSAPVKSKGMARYWEQQ